jgi:hypothetical protein
MSNELDFDEEELSSNEDNNEIDSEEELSDENNNEIDSEEELSDENNNEMDSDNEISEEDNNEISDEDDGIKIRINKSPKTGLDREVRLFRLAYVDFEGKFAEIQWKVYQLDDNGNRVNHPDIAQGRVVNTPINNSNKVTPEGMLITREVIISTNPIQDGESESNYLNRIDNIFNNVYQNGIPEFDFWLKILTTLPLPIALTQAAQLLDHFGRFDRV